MRQDIDMRTILNEAAKSGLLLGLFTGVFIYAAMLVGMINSGSFGVKLVITVVNALLWMLKFVGCLWLLRFFMIRFAVANPTLTPRSSFRFGMFTALFSAIIVAGIGLVNITLIAPESMQSAIEAAMQSYSSALSASDQVTFGKNAQPPAPDIILFISSLVYCFLFGTVAAKIFSASIPPRDIFGEPTDSNEE